MKNKSNLAIILIVVFTSLTVIVAVIAAGLFKSKDKSSDSGPSAAVVAVSEKSEPQSEPEPVSAAEQESSSAAEAPSLPESSSQDIENDVGQNIAELAKSLLGVPFAENGETPSGFDNSGFIYYVLRQNGYITCPRTTLAQSEMGTKEGRDSLKKGDLVFFSDEGGDGVSFGGIYIGDGAMIACLMPGTNVKEIDISTDYYISHFVCGISLS